MRAREHETLRGALLRMVSIGGYVREYRLRIAIMGNYRGGNRSWAWHNRTGPRPQHVRSSASTYCLLLRFPLPPSSFTRRLLSYFTSLSLAIGSSDSQFRRVFVRIVCVCVCVCVFKVYIALVVERKRERVV